MITPINSLMNMEMALYGGASSMSAPSFYNGYMGGYSNNSYNSYNSLYNNYYNPAFMGGYNYGQGYDTTTFGQGIPQGYANAASGQQQNQDTIFAGLNKKQVGALVQNYADGLNPAQTFMGAAAGGALSGALMMNPRILAHPWNAATSFADVKEMFKDVKTEGSAMNKLWKENHNVMEEAYAQMQRATARSKSKLGIFRQRYTDAEFKQVKDIMDKALKTGNVDEIAKATETLRHANSCNNGWFFKGWNKVKGLFGKENLPTVASRLKDTKHIAEATAETLGYNKMTWGKAFKKSGGKMGMAFGLIEILLNLGKIKTAKQKDQENAQNGKKTNFGAKQTKQTILKALVNTAAWTAGETASIWAFSKLGASLGTAVSPGVGTAIGAVVGFVGGSLGCWLGEKLINRPLIGQDVADKIEAENKLKNAEGQQELLKYTVEQAQKGKLKNAEAAGALQQLMAAYA